MHRLPVVTLCFAACQSTDERPPPPCSFREVTQTVDFTAEEVVAAASVDRDLLSWSRGDAFVDPADAAAWDGLPVHVEHRFTAAAAPTVVAFYPDPDPFDSHVCPVGRALRIPVAYHASVTIGSAHVDHDRPATGLALLATAAELDALSFDDPATALTSELGSTSTDEAAWLAQTKVGQDCPVPPTLWFDNLPGDLDAGSWAAAVAWGGLSVTCPDEGGQAFLGWGVVPGNDPPTTTP